MIGEETDKCAHEHVHLSMYAAHVPELHQRMRVRLHGHAQVTLLSRINGIATVLNYRRTVEIHASKFFMLPSLQMNTQATSLGYTKAPASLRPGRSSAPGISPQQRKKIRDRFSWVAVQS